jgi:hypothetical protein
MRWSRPSTLLKSTWQTRSSTSSMTKPPLLLLASNALLRFPPALKRANDVRSDSSREDRTAGASNPLFSLGERAERATQSLRVLRAEGEGRRKMQLCRTPPAMPIQVSTSGATCGRAGTASTASSIPEVVLCHRFLVELVGCAVVGVVSLLLGLLLDRKRGGGEEALHLLVPGVSQGLADIQVQ